MLTDFLFLAIQTGVLFRFSRGIGSHARIPPTHSCFGYGVPDWLRNIAPIMSRISYSCVFFSASFVIRRVKTYSRYTDKLLSCSLGNFRTLESKVWPLIGDGQMDVHLLKRMSSLVRGIFLEFRGWRLMVIRCMFTIALRNLGCV